MSMFRLVVVFAFVLGTLSLLRPTLAKFGVPRLPGDLWLDSGNLHLYLPLTSAVIVSVVVSLLFWLIAR